MIRRIVQLLSRALPALLLLMAQGCAPLEKHVDLTYEKFVNAAGGSGDLFIAEPVMQQKLGALPSGKQIVGTEKGTDLVVTKSPADWLRSALAQELSAAGYSPRMVKDLPAGVSKGIKTAILVLTASQATRMLTVVTVTEVKLEVEVWKNGQLVNRLTASARDQEEGMDRSAEPIRSAFQRTLQRALQELVPDIVKNLEQ